MDFENIRIDEIKESPYQGRIISIETKKGQIADPSLRELEISIHNQGLITPIIIRPSINGYELIDGHRRVEIFKKLNHTHIPAIIKEADDGKAQAYSIIGNLHRKNLSTIEKAIAFKKIMDSKIFQDVKELSVAVGKHESYVGDILNTLKMDQRIIDDLAKNKSTDDVRLLRAIRKVEKAVDNHSEKQWALYTEFLTNKLSRKEVMDRAKGDPKKTLSDGNVEVDKTTKSIFFRTKQIPDNHIEQIQKLIEEYLKENT